MVTINGVSYDTNTQSGRADARKAGAYIDDSGVYAPGSGDRVGDTYSGDQSNNNVAPSPTQLPIVNGNPVSPSNGFSGPQTPYIMYRGDPQYAGYFGPGTPGYSSTSRTYNAVPGALPAGQQTLADVSPTRAAPAPGTGQPVSPPANASVRVNNSQDQTNQTQFLNGVQSANPGGGYGPYATPEAPQLTAQGQYTDSNGQLVEKSVDQYGHEYFRTVQGNVSLPTTIAPGQQAQTQGPGTATAGTQPQNPAQQPTTNQRVPGEPEKPATFGGERDLVPLAMPDGKVVQVPREFYQEYLAAGQAQAAAAKAATQFQQGIDQGKLDVERMVAEYNKQYQQAIIQGQSADRAQQLAIAQMNAELTRQAQALTKQQQDNQVMFEQQQLANQRSQQGQTNALEQEKLSLQRQQLRGHRSLPSVRFR